MAPRFPSGSWFGYFSYAGLPASDRVSTQLTIQFEGEKVAGHGRDADGPYVVDGAVDGGGEVRWIKRYDGGLIAGTRVAYHGTLDAETGAIEGRWRIVDGPTHGTFSLRSGRVEDWVDEGAIRSALTSASPLAAHVRIDLEALRFDGEREMLLALAADPDFVAAVRAAKASDRLGRSDPAPDFTPYPRTKLGPRTLPIAFDALERCRSALGLTAPVELYVENDGHLNASVETTADGRIQIVFTSAVLDRLDLEELTAIVGHELGHALLGHLETRVASDETLAGVTQLRRLALARYQELSADRVGLLCSGDPVRALRTEFMLHTGITNRDRIGSAERLEATALEAAARGDGVAASSGYDTHPCGAFRTLALAWFGRSATYHTLRGATPPQDAMPDAELEAKVAELVAVMNPAVLDAKACDAEIDELVALTGLAVAGADSRTTKREISAIRTLSPGISAALDRVMAVPFEIRQLRSLDLAERLALLLPPHHRERIVEDLAMIAQVDGHLSPEELDVLDGIGILLEVGGGHADALLAELRHGLD